MTDEAAPAKGSAAVITIEAFCELDATRELLASCTEDRRIARSRVRLYDGGLPAAIERLHDHATPSLVIVETGMRGRGLFEQLEELVRVCDPGAKALVIGAVDEPALRQALADQGVAFLAHPLAAGDLLSAIAGVIAEPVATPLGRKIAVVGAKAGAGASTIARGLAWCAGELLGLETTLMDLDRPRGGQGRGAQLAQALARIDGGQDAACRELLERRGERLASLAGVADAQDEIERSPEAWAELIHAVRQESRLLVVDLPWGWPRWARATARRADEVVIAATPDLASLQQAKLLHEALAAMRPDDPAPKLVLNQVGGPTRPQIPVKSFADFVGAAPAAVLPYDAVATAAALDCGSVVEAAPESRLAEGLADLAAQLSGQVAPARRRSLVRRMLRG